MEWLLDVLEQADSVVNPGLLIAMTLAVVGSWLTDKGPGKVKSLPWLSVGLAVVWLGAGSGNSDVSMAGCLPLGYGVYVLKKKPTAEAQDEEGMEGEDGPEGPTTG